MKNCTDCKHAKWKRNAAGNLHPSGDGRCGFKFKMPPIPASMKWRTYMMPIEPYGGEINRRAELPDHCAHFARDA